MPRYSSKSNDGAKQKRTGCTKMNKLMHKKEHPGGFKAGGEGLKGNPTATAVSIPDRYCEEHHVFLTKETYCLRCEVGHERLKEG